MNGEFKMFDLSKGDDDLSKEAAETYRAENQPRGEEALKDAGEYERLLKRQAELEAQLRAMGVNPDDIKDKPEATEEAAAEPAEAAPEEEVTPVVVAEKLKKNRGAKATLTNAVRVGLGALGVTLLTGAIYLSPKKDNKAQTAPVAQEAIAEDGTTSMEAELDGDLENENTQFAGETIDGVKYDYEEYADRENKEAYNAYGYDKSEAFGDQDKTIEGILNMAEKEPEALASYAYNIFTDAEKEELGIKGLTMVQIDEKFNGKDGGELQQKLLEKFDQVLKDEKTTFKFYRENNTEKTNYIYFVDENKDGNFTPDELHLGYDTKKRNNAPQVDICRLLENEEGNLETIKMLDLNMQCGYQPNYEKAPAGVPEIPADKPVSVVPPAPDPDPEPTPDPTPDPDPEPIPIPTPTPPKPKDPDNLKRIDEKIKKDIAEDVGTKKIVIDPNPGVSDDDITDKPTGDTNPAPTIVENDSSREAEDVHPSEENDYSSNNDDTDYSVQEDTSGQEEADRNETSKDDAPTGGKDLSNALGDLGIE